MDMKRLLLIALVALGGWSCDSKEASDEDFARDLAVDSGPDSDLVEDLTEIDAVGDVEDEAEVRADMNADTETDADDVESDTQPPIEVGSVSRDKRFDVEVTEDVVFAQGLTHTSWGAPDPTTMDLLLDVYRPIRENPPPMPVAVVIHGGGFRGGTHKHRALSEMAMHFAERGWVARAKASRKR